MGNIVESAEGIVAGLYLYPSSGNARLFLTAVPNLTGSISILDNVSAYRSCRYKNRLL